MLDQLIKKITSRLIGGGNNCYLQPCNVILTSILNSFPIMVVALLLASVFACLVHRVRGPTSTADPLEGFYRQNRESSSPERNMLRGLGLETLTPSAAQVKGAL